MTPQDEQEIPLVYLKPGELYFSRDPAVVVTVLGSCISVTMFCKRLGIGGICHGLLPQCTGDGQGNQACSGDCVDGLKYVDCSVRKMVKMFDQYKVPRGEIESKCFGGADLFEHYSGPLKAKTVGAQNIAAAENILRREGLKPVAADIGGAQGRKIFFYTNTGEVLLKRLNRGQNPPSNAAVNRGQRG
jgi:chemotaxis protein CheD